MRLGTLLLRDAVISLTQLEQALRAQVLCGGRLGTNLVELGFVDINTLGRYLARILDLPLAIADRFEKADPRMIESFGAELADHYTAIPLGFEKGEPHTLAIAMADPSNRRAVAELEDQLKLSVRPYVAAELRVLYYLERYYGIRRRTRFTREPGESTSPRPSRRERRATQPFGGTQATPTFRIEPRRKRESAAPAERRQPTVLGFDEAREKIDEASKRDVIAQAILDYSVGRFACAAVFMVRSHQAIGWLAQAPGLGIDALERLNISLDGVSIFQAAHDSRTPYRGNALSPGHPVERELWEHFALEGEPQDLHVVPVLVADRVVNLVYAHSYSQSPASDDDVRELRQLASRSGHAYARLIASSKAE